MLKILIKKHWKARAFSFWGSELAHFGPMELNHATFRLKLRFTENLKKNIVYKLLSKLAVKNCDNNALPRNV